MDINLFPMTSGMGKRVNNERSGALEGSGHFGVSERGSGASK